ncbi:hypothetical protein, partial [Lacticaseibacillus paracasei]|uniref:hypothetical protein n=1 Tax=Lacticaseibacillus paracasei TaxID=1597 RepID=UPI00161767CC
IFAHAITTDAWRNSLDHYQEFVIIVALDLKIEDMNYFKKNTRCHSTAAHYLSIRRTTPVIDMPS